MFKLVDLRVDYKELEIIKNALTNEISYLEEQIFITDDDRENIEEHKQVLNKVNKEIKFILGEY